MKKTVCIILTAVLLLCLTACSKPENKADISLREGETKITGKVEKVNGNTLLISDGHDGKFSFFYDESIVVVEDGYYVVDYTADSFKGKMVSVICSDKIMETYPAQLTGERMIIIEDDSVKY